MSIIGRQTTEKEATIEAKHKILYVRTAAMRVYSRLFFKISKTQDIAE
jgi:hypothetical protein